MLLSSYNRVTTKFILETSEGFYGEKDRMVDVEFPVKLRGNTFHQLMILSPTFSPKEVYGSPDTRRLGLGITSMWLNGRPYKNLAAGGTASNFTGAPGVTPEPAGYPFPILA